MNAYRRQIYATLRSLLCPRGPFNTALDIGSGDGWFAMKLAEDNVVSNVVPVDVQPRRHCFIRPQLFSGDRLPFEDRSFDLCYCIDVLHHCRDPLSSLLDVLRCSRNYVAIKDHTYRTEAQRLLLCVLDEIGNRRFGVPSLYHYQRDWQWFPHIEAAGFALEELVYPAPCHGKPLGWLTDPVQFISLWRRQPPGAPPLSNAKGRDQ